MMVTFVCECEKKALDRTRRVLDAFANRIGSRTWQTVITEEGLDAVKKLLRKTASKNTAVACHWIRSRSRSDLLWIIGNRNKFNAQGIVPVNFTNTEISQFMDNSQWQTIEIIKYASAIAGLFHDFGKANVLFQAKIDPDKRTPISEPYRHEWLSLRLFQSFAEGKTDTQWLDALTQIESSAFSALFKDGLDGNLSNNHPINNLSPFAKLIAWLILTHHRLPIYPAWKETSPPALEYVDKWLGCNFEAFWNSHHCKDDNQLARVQQNWQFKGLPVESMQWRSKACLLASETKTKLSRLLSKDHNWLDEHLLTSHLSRLCLMLADHYYSAQDITPEWQNPHYDVYANSDKKTKQLKQKLDEHLIGVAFHAQNIAKSLPKFNASLKPLKKNPFLEKNVSKKYKIDFGWQDDAKKLAQNLSKDSLKHGFFGINMASTGKGKTLANAKIMYALGSATGRIRFSIALGLRTLTLQTGRAFKEMLELSNEELAIMVGGIAAKQLFENEQNKVDNTNHQTNIDESSESEKNGSESEEAILNPDLYVDYTGKTHKHSLSDWTKKDENLEKLIQAPVLVCTIDHLIPATEGTKGGKQIAPMLRLLSSDLVLDEPDDFGLDDLPALCRLVHWAGILGSRVLLSTATMPPTLAYALYQAYYAGWTQYAKVNIEDWNSHISCAWFDEFNTCSEPVKDFDAFKTLHKKFIDSRIKELNKNSQPKCKGQIIPINKTSSDNIAVQLADTIQEHIVKLHERHHQYKDGKHISIGLVRMANIDPLVAVAKTLLEKNVNQADTCIHYCVYHSHYPIGIRSYLENQLDNILNRQSLEKIWQNEHINNKLKEHSQVHHIFVVLASPVAEVGRDHDYDWAIVEPSSMRSIIQLAGRVLRHRNNVPETANILLLNENYKALANKKICYEKPGFESMELQLANKDLLNLLDTQQYQSINAIPRITLPTDYKDKKSPFSNLADLEHKALEMRLLGKQGAKIWWRNAPHWCGEVQRQQRFRDSKQDEAYYLWLENEYSTPKWKWKNEHIYPAKFADQGSIAISNSGEIKIGTGNHFWFNLEPLTVYAELAKDFSIDLAEVSQRFGEVRLIEYENNTQQEYNYHPNLGLYKELGKTQ